MKKYVLLTAFVFSNTVIYSQNLQPTDTEALLNVLVVDFQHKTLEAEQVSFIGQKDGKTYSGITKEDGRFSILVPEGQKYKVQYKDFTIDMDYKMLDLPSVDGPIQFDFTLKIAQSKVFTLRNVFYDTGKSTLRPESYKELNELVEYLKIKKKLQIEIAGHTDSVGSKESNQKLSEDRSNTVRNYLIKNGIEASRVTAKGYGDSQPIGDNNTPEGKQKNRRTEVHILN